MRPVWIAIQFLTRIPIRLKGAIKPAEQGEAVAWFPLAGLLIGLLLLGLRQLLLLDPSRAHEEASAFIMLLAWLWLGGSLHLDGLADSLDGLASAKQGPAMLKVMRDPGLGAFGAMGLVMALLCMGVYFYALPPYFLWYLPLPMVVSRGVQSMLCAWNDYAGKPKSFSAGFIAKAKPLQAYLAMVMVLIAFVLLSGEAEIFKKTNLKEILLTLPALIVAPLAGYALGLRAIKKAGGLTGDICGYASMITECLSALLLLFFMMR
jgi:adenosylcobinamide-GDP ribazoletransferase